MHQPLFLQTAILRAGDYLPGSYAWAADMRLESAVLVLAPPAAGELTLTLEVAGALTNKSFTVLPADLPEVRQNLTLGVKVTAGQVVRWKVTAFAGADEEASPRAAITLAVNREADTRSATPDLTVWWVDGAEKFRLFRYVAATGAFLEVTTGLASGRASVTAGEPFTIAIEGTEVLRVEGQTLKVAALAAGQFVVADAPQLQFYVGPAPVATLSKAGLLRVAGAAEQTPVDQTGQFLLGDGAALNAEGVLAVAFAPP